MATITLKYDARNINVKNIINGLINMGVFEVETTEKPHYNTSFVNKIKVAEQNVKKGNTTKINPNKLWESIQ